MIKENYYIKSIEYDLAMTIVKKYHYLHRNRLGSTISNLCPSLAHTRPLSFVLWNGFISSGRRSLSFSTKIFITFFSFFSFIVSKFF